MIGINTEPERIVEILGRSEQGSTRPFICRTAAGDLYYVKGHAAGYWGLCAEWCAGQLAKWWGVSVAPFALLEVPESLARGSLRGDIDDLGSGLVFGSRFYPGTVDADRALLRDEDILYRYRAPFVLFDWWIANPNRQADQFGGDLNLLFSIPQSSIVLMDHDQAFNPPRMPYSFATFYANHVFGSDITLASTATSQLPAEWFPEEMTGLPKIEYAPEDSILQHFHKKLRDSWEKESNCLAAIFDEMPQSWLEASDFSYDEIYKLLNRVHHAAFIDLTSAPDGIVPDNFTPDNFTAEAI